MGKEAAGFEVGLTGDDQIRIALGALANNGGEASIQEIYTAVERRMAPKTLSQQGRSSVRFFVNRVAVQAGYVQPYDKEHPGWRITPEGRTYSLEPQPDRSTEVVNVDTNTVETVKANAVLGQAFELYVLSLLKVLYPHHAWFHQGRFKATERGLDFIGNRVGENPNAEERSIGVQVKFHTVKNAPKNDEWLKFLAGSVARRLDMAVFITTGRLTSEQRREAGEANVLVIEGREELSRVATANGIAPFELSDDHSSDGDQDIE